VIHATEILGRLGDPRYAGRRVDPLVIASGDAGKRRLRRVTVSGREVAIDLARGSFLAEGDVLADDGERVIAVERAIEEALVVRLYPRLDRSALVEISARIGHAFGNQHVPIDVADGQLLIPITTSADLAQATIEALGLAGVEVDRGSAKLARVRPLPIGHAHASNDGGTTLRPKPR
jgi:urease accessory protein